MDNYFTPKHLSFNLQGTINVPRDPIKIGSVEGQKFRRANLAEAGVVLNKTHHLRVLKTAGHEGKIFNYEYQKNETTEPIHNVLNEQLSLTKKSFLE